MVNGRAVIDLLKRRKEYDRYGAALIHTHSCHTPLVLHSVTTRLSSVWTMSVLGYICYPASVTLSFYGKLAGAAVSTAELSQDRQWC